MFWDHFWGTWVSCWRVINAQKSSPTAFIEFVQGTTCHTLGIRLGIADSGKCEEPNPRLREELVSTAQARRQVEQGSFESEQRRSRG